MLCENNGQPCACKYCSGTKLQGQVNSKLGIFTEDRAGRVLSTEALARREEKKRVKREAKAAKAKADPDRKPPKPRRSQDNSVQPPAAKRTKKPYEGAYVDKDRDRDLAEVACTFRQGEMVWCRLEKPVTGGWIKDLVIDYWPAMCESRELFTSGVVEEDPSSVNGSSLIRDGQFQATAVPKIRVTHEYKWKLRLLGVGDPLLCTEDHILPWLEYPPEEDLFNIPLKRSPLTQAWGSNSTDRIALEQLANLPLAITPFALALQIAAHVVSYWNLFGRYDLPTMKALQADGHVFPEEDKKEVKEDLALAYFQVLWWGAEKIWSGELVRLVVGRDDLPPDLRQPSPEPADKCYFLKISAIYRGADDRPAIKGAVWELAPRDEHGDIPKEEVEYHASLDASMTQYIPRAPPGYYFRCLSQPGTERHLVLEHIAGRYYPWESLRIGANDEPNPGDTAATDAVTGRSRSLCGLSNGGNLVMKSVARVPFLATSDSEADGSLTRRAQNWIANRKEALKMSEKVAETEMESHFKDQEAKEAKDAAEAERVAGNMDTTYMFTGNVV